MPTTYAHYRFGKDVIKDLPEPFKAEVKEDRQLFDIGLHGPDIFFYYRILSGDHVNMLGNKIHDGYADGFFAGAAGVIEKSRDIRAAKAYIDGFICHFALDSGIHGFVEKIMQVSGISHVAIERELDRRLMTMDGLDPVTHVPSGHITPSRENAEVIAPFFEGVNAATIEKVLRSMRRYLAMLLPMGNFKKAAARLLFKAAGCYESYFGIFMQKKPDIKCAPYLDVLLRVYRESIPKAVELITQYQRFLSKKEGLSDMFHKTFGPGEHWKDIVLQL